MIPEQRITESEIDSLLLEGWKLIDLRFGIPKMIWDNMIGAYEKLGINTHRVIFQEDVPMGIKGVILVSPRCSPPG